MPTMHDADYSRTSMSVPLHNQIRPGTLVSIVLKQDQRTGRQVQGAVSQVLTRGNHPRGVKVRLSDGRIGRVQRLVDSNSTNAPIPAQRKPQNTTHRMAEHNPWASDDTPRNTGLGSQSNNPYLHQQRDPSPSYQQQSPYRDEPQSQHQPQNNDYQSYGSGMSQGNQPSYQAYQPPSGPPPGQSFGQAYDQSYDQSYNQQPDYNAWEGASGNPPLPARHPARNAVPSQNIRRSDTDDLLDSQDDRAEQVEHLQAYEATANTSIDDQNRAQLEKEFPGVDGSLIAALYSDTKNLADTREMLQELARQ